MTDLSGWAGLSEGQVERAVLGAFLLDPQWEQLSRLKPDLFFDGRNRQVARAILRLHAAGQPYDVISVRVELETLAVDQQFDGSMALYLTSLIDEVVTTTTTDHYVSVLEDCYLRRMMISLAGELRDKSADRSISLDALHSVVEDLAAKLASCSPDSIQTIGELVADGLETLLQRLDGSLGISTGYKALDRRIIGLLPGAYIIAGRPGTGKTTFALNWMLKQAQAGHRVGLISLEMPFDRLLGWMIDWYLRADHQYVPLGGTRAEWASKIVLAAGELRALGDRIVIDDSPYKDVLEVVSVAHKMRFANKIDVLYIDYLQLLESRAGNTSREREVATISRRLTALKKQLGIPIVLLSQLNRELATSKIRRPQLHQLRESGALEQDADVVFMTHDPTQFSDSKDVFHEVHIVKNRSGPVTGSSPVLFRFDKAGKRFDSAIQEKEEREYEQHEPERSTLFDPPESKAPQA